MQDPIKNFRRSRNKILISNNKQILYSKNGSKLKKYQNPDGPLEIDSNGLDLSVTKFSDDYYNRVGENAMHRAQASSTWHEATTGIPSIPKMIEAGYHWLMSSPNFFGNSEKFIPPITGTAPDVTPGKIIKEIKTISKSAKLINQARKEDKALGIGKKLKNIVKQGKGFDAGDARHVNSGQSRVQNEQIRLAIEQMANPSYNKNYAQELNRLQVKLAKSTNPEVQKRINGEIRDLAKRFINDGLLH